jgi:hypothetical protein
MLCYGLTISLAKWMGCQCYLNELKNSFQSHENICRGFLCETVFHRGKSVLSLATLGEATQRGMIIDIILKRTD